MTGLGKIARATTVRPVGMATAIGVPAATIDHATIDHAMTGLGKIARATTARPGVTKRPRSMLPGPRVTARPTPRDPIGRSATTSPAAMTGPGVATARAMTAHRATTGIAIAPPAIVRRNVRPQT